MKAVLVGIASGFYNATFSRIGFKFQVLLSS